jgi:hypothetical protein
MDYFYKLLICLYYKTHKDTKNKKRKNKTFGSSMHDLFGANP